MAGKKEADSLWYPSLPLRRRQRRPDSSQRLKGDGCFPGTEERLGSTAVDLSSGPGV